MLTQPSGLQPTCEPIVPCAALTGLSAAYDVSACGPMQAGRSCAVPCAAGFVGETSFYSCPEQNTNTQALPTISGPLAACDPITPCATPPPRYDAPVEWTRIERSCVTGHSIQLFQDVSVAECKSLCLQTPGCAAFEYGVQYGGHQGTTSQEIVRQRTVRCLMDATALTSTSTCIYCACHRLQDQTFGATHTALTLLELSACKVSLYLVSLQLDPQQVSQLRSASRQASIAGLRLRNTALTVEQECLTAPCFRPVGCRKMHTQHRSSMDAWCTP